MVLVEELLDRIVACNDEFGMHKWNSSEFDFCVFNWIFVHPDLEQVAESIGVEVFQQYVSFVFVPIEPFVLGLNVTSGILLAGIVRLAGTWVSVNPNPFGLICGSSLSGEYLIVGLRSI